jgi:DNA end-binding protein Ku
MAHAIWSGTINFGLVTIPVKLFTAVRETGGVSFNYLHKDDSGRIKYERVCSECGKKVPWNDIVKGYEYEKGNYVLVTDEDLKKANVEATQTVEIVQFCDLSEIDPIYFDKPYYLEPEKKGRHAYALLREALESSGKVGIARVVIRSREHLAALKPLGDALVVEMMHWPDEIVDRGQLDFPPAKKDMPAAEMKAAAMLIETMTAKFEPDQFHDRYREDVMELIEKRAEGKPVRAKGKAPRANVLDLVSVLKRSLEERAPAAAHPHKGPAKAKPRAKHPKHGKKRAA